MRWEERPGQGRGGLYRRKKRRKERANEVRKKKKKREPEDRPRQDRRQPMTGEHPPRLPHHPRVSISGRSRQCCLHHGQVALSGKPVLVASSLHHRSVPFSASSPFSISSHQFHSGESTPTAVATALPAPLLNKGYHLLGNHPFSPTRSLHKDAKMCKAPRSNYHSGIGLPLNKEQIAHQCHRESDACLLFLPHRGVRLFAIYCTPQALYPS